jgi:hypothetical protein
MSTFDTYLSDLVGNQTLPADIRQLAAQTLEEWNQGVVPAQRTLKRLSHAQNESGACRKLERDGACGWLRKHGRGHGLQVPPVGTRAMCSFRGSFASCPGFRRIK